MTGTSNESSAAKIKVHPSDCECESCEEFERLAAESANARSAASEHGDSSKDFRASAHKRHRRSRKLRRALNRPWYWLALAVPPGLAVALPYPVRRFFFRRGVRGI